MMNGTPWTARPDDAAEERAWRAWRRTDPLYGAFGVVVGSTEERAAVTRAEQYARSQPGPRIPLVTFLFVNAADFPHHRGACEAVRRPPPIGIVLRCGLGFEGTFLTCVHELQHVRDVAAGLMLPPDEMEARAVTAEARALAERWKW